MMTDEEANSLTRRKYLQGGAALAAGAALAGCGGGEDEQLAVQSITVSSADESAGGARDRPMAAAYTRLIPMSTVVRQVWHIEVAFRGSYGTKVEIIDKNNKATVIGEKAVGILRYTICNLRSLKLHRSVRQLGRRISTQSGT